MAYIEIKNGSSYVKQTIASQNTDWIASYATSETSVLLPVGVIKQKRSYTQLDSRKRSRIE